MQRLTWWELMLIGLAALTWVTAWVAPRALRASDPVLAVALSLRRSGFDLDGVDPWGNLWLHTARDAQRNSAADSPYSMGPNQIDDRGGGDDIRYWSVDFAALYYDWRVVRLVDLPEQSLGLALLLLWVVLAGRALRGERRALALEALRVLLAASGPIAACAWIVAWDGRRMQTVASEMRPLAGVLLAPAELAMTGTLSLACLLVVGMVRLRRASAAEGSEPEGVEPAPLADLPEGHEPQP